MNLPQKAKAFITSKFRGQEIYEINKEKTKLWIKIVNTSYTEDFKVKKKTPLGFLVIEPEHLKDKNGRKKKQNKGFTKKLGTAVEVVLAEEKIANEEAFSVDMIYLTWEEILLTK